MDSTRFDDWTKLLATRTTRRRALRGLAGGAVAALGLRRWEATAQPATVTICHWDARQGRYQQLTISPQGLAGHSRHLQDILMPDFTSPVTCGDCNTACATGQACIDGTCVSSCVPDCTDRECGDDGCGGSCGSCGSNEECDDGTCVSSCVPDCTGKACGASDGCDGICLDGFCGSNEVCLAGVCHRQCLTDGDCGSKPGAWCIDGACQCLPQTHDCGRRCLTYCSFRPAYFRDRFQYCLANILPGGCEYCTAWMGCYGELDTETTCGVDGVVVGECY
jgi:hypothetical protein